MANELPAWLPDGLWCYRLDARRFILGGAFSTGGNFHEWVIRNFNADADQVERRIARMPAAGHGLVVLPLLAGERSPGYAPRATGAIAGLTQATTAVEIVRAGLEAVAIEFARADRLLDEILPAQAWRRLASRSHV
jgi:gluconokinase